eukprot:GSChrysophyteH1.ASY1.ANO1.1159.1 assembled CDS
MFKKVLVSAPDTCENDGVTPSSNNTDPDTAAQNWEWEISLLVLMSLSVLACFMYSHKIFEKYTIHPPKAEFVEYSTNALNETSSRESVNWNNSIMCNKSIPQYIRLAMPLLIVSVMGLFLASNLDPNAVRVMASVRINNFELEPIQAFTFTLSGTVRDMWNAKVYPLSILIAFFSGCWPYVKLAVMLASWTVPVGYISKSCRNFMLRFLDAYGKYSLLDFYVMILMLCAFHFEMYLLGQDINGQSKVEVDLFVEPGFGFVSFLAATLASLLLGHVVLAFHRFDEDPSESKTLEIATGKEKLSHHRFLILPRTAQRIGLYRALESIAAFAYLTTFILLIYTAYAVTFSFDIDGLAGWILGSAHETNYSIISVGKSMAESSPTPNSFVIRLLQTCFFIFSLAMPLFAVILFAILWLGPALTLSSHKVLLVLTEVVYAWSAVDCFCVSVFAALLEITQFAAFIVGDSCDGINEYLEEFMDTQLHGDDQCFDVQTTLYPVCFLMFFASFLLLLFSIPSLWYCELAFKDRIELARNPLQKGCSISIPVNETYDAIEFNVNLFGKKAMIKQTELATRLLDEDYSSCNKEVGSDSGIEPAPGFCGEIYRYFSDALFRFLWSWKVICVSEAFPTTETESSR